MSYVEEEEENEPTWRVALEIAEALLAILAVMGLVLLAIFVVIGSFWDM